MLTRRSLVMKQSIMLDFFLRQGCTQNFFHLENGSAFIGLWFSYLFTLLLGNTSFLMDAGKDRHHSNNKRLMQHAFTEPTQMSETVWALVI